ncbi:MAG: type II toxin-antitoxin system RelE/ParE family toxin [Gemmataceae bacterium]
MTVEWTEPADAQFQAIRAGGGSAGSALAGRIARRVSDLERLPLLGGVVPDYSDPALRELIEPPYRIIYRVLDDRLQIIAVIHAARRLPRTPPG